MFIEKQPPPPLGGSVLRLEWAPSLCEFPDRSMVCCECPIRAVPSLKVTHGVQSKGVGGHVGIRRFRG